MGNEAADILHLQSGLLQRMVKRIDHIAAGMDKYIAAVGHSDAVLLRTQTHAFGAFADIAQSLGKDGIYLPVSGSGLLLGKEESYGAVSPQMSGLGVGFVAVVGVVFAAYQERFRRLAGFEIGLHHLQPVDER